MGLQVGEADFAIEMRGRLWQPLRERKVSNWLLLAPSLLISLMVVFVPGVLTILVSLTDWDGVSPEFTFIGFDNFKELFADTIFWHSAMNNATWTVLFLTIPVAIGLVSAVFLFRIKRGRTAYQLVFLFPYVLAPVTNAMLWLNIILNPISGIIAYLNKVGIPIAPPLASMKTALYGVAAVDIWHFWGFLTVVYLAALRQTSVEQIEAAQVEGCNGWQLFRFVYFPSIRPTFQLMFVMIMINSFLTFDYIYLLTGGGPSHATEMLSTYAYTFAFSAFQVGKASAVALFMSLFGLAASCLYVRLSRRDAMV
jgi:raffinose/stachyose/melibiose transport system permease protein